MQSLPNFKSSNRSRYECMADNGCIILAVAFSLAVMLICIVFTIACCKKRHLNRIRTTQSPIIQHNYNLNSSAPPPYNWYSESPPPPYNQVKL
ncbi:unnamed protein product [Rotaria sp. Silwood1]|nr:unnamed protein product [Rotaria sp. Silwood1]CAF1352935.1 unnamed protein product [Rotaria sp. Silwood1]CAF1355392.1 unnamed protein product [Rotaria sp. Silwood1]CAF3574356.1 unnamed protein product [Rotaria sp. Silwood1]CAF3591919.1 unnamed protein product [Rotaria sp. Silwood1]